MLILKRDDTARRATDTLKLRLWGAVITLTVAARTESLVQEVRKKHKNKKGRYDEEAIQDEMFDRLLVNIEGVGEEQEDGTVKPMEVNLANKKKILFLDVPTGEPTVLARVLDKANGLAFDVEEDEGGN